MVLLTPIILDTRAVIISLMLKADKYRIRLLIELTAVTN